MHVTEMVLFIHMGYCGHRPRSNHANCALRVNPAKITFLHDDKRTGVPRRCPVWTNPCASHAVVGLSFLVADCFDTMRISGTYLRKCASWAGAYHAGLGALCWMMHLGRPRPGHRYRRRIEIRIRLSSETVPGVMLSMTWQCGAVDGPTSCSPVR